MGGAAGYETSTGGAAGYETKKNVCMYRHVMVTGGSP